MKKAERELQETKAYLESIIKSVADAIIVLDYDGKVKTVNPVTVRLLGYDGEKDLLNRAIAMLIAEEEGSLLFKPSDFNRLIHEGSVNNVEALFRTKGEGRIPMLLSGSVLRSDRGKLLGIVLVAKDITEFKKVEKMKDEFLSTVSHELRTPIAIVRAAIANLKDGIAGPLAPKQAQIVEISDRNCSRLARLIEKLLDLSRLEPGQSKIHSMRFSLSALIHEVVRGFRVTTNEAKALVEEVPDSLPALTADRNMMARVLTHLLENAIHYAKANVLVKASMSEEKSEMTVSVTNDGCDIPQEERKELFNKFVQLHRPQGGAGYGGIGLGLAICKDIVETHGGKIWVESAEGAGVSFHFTLPVIPPATLAEVQASPREAEGHERI